MVVFGADGVSNVIYCGAFTGTINVDGNIFSPGGTVGQLRIECDKNRYCILGKTLSSSKITYIECICADTTSTPIMLVTSIQDSLYQDKYSLYPNP